MKKIIVIPARYPSTRLPGKPLREISGKPIIQWVYEAAQKSALKDSIVIATDDTRIRDAALSFGAEVAMTSPDCRSGTDRVCEALRGKEADIIVNLQGDEPFIRPDIVDLLFSSMELERLQMGTICSPVKDAAEYVSPNIVKVVLDKFGFALYFSRSPIPYFRDNDILLDFRNPPDVRPGQAQPAIPRTSARDRRNPQPIYKHVGVYGFSRSFLEQYVTMEKSSLEQAESLEQLRVLENGYKIKVLITDYDGFGIDTEEDLLQAQKLILNSKH
jgi:3-deoxy-manno-octulosonate cytidylyltransferase (CMP-KDO synthetase)